MSKIRKAITAFFATAFAAALTAIVTNGAPSGASGWAGLVGTALAAGVLAAAAVWRVPNDPQNPLAAR